MSGSAVVTACVKTVLPFISVLCYVFTSWNGRSMPKALITARVLLARREPRFGACTRGILSVSVRCTWSPI